MKRFLSCFLVACGIFTTQVLLKANADAEAAKDIPTLALTSVNKNVDYPIPKLLEVVQISPNQIQVTYDRDVDMDLGKKPTNCWIQSTKNDKPKGIATLGKNDKVNKDNSLTDKNVKIESKDNSANTFILTFNDKIKKGEEYKLIICYVTVKGAPAYNGDNGMGTFIGN